MKQFLRDAAAVTHVSGLCDAFARHLAAHGIHAYGYVNFLTGHITPTHLLGDFPGFPDDWGEQYLTKNWEVDPVRSLAAVHPVPFRWSEMEKIRSLSAEEKVFQKLVEHYGFRDGLIIPVFGPANRNGYIVLSLSGPHKRLSPSIIAEYRALCQYLHLRYWELVPPTDNQSALLSRREQEVLRWVARGKSNSVIADILGVSANTVDTHLRRIYRKLDVCDRVSAAVAGLNRGFIALN